MNGLDRDILRLIELIYEAACDESIWPEVLTGIADVLHSTGGILLYEDNQDLEIQFAKIGRLSDEGMPEYAEYYNKIDCRTRAILEKPVGAIETDDSLLRKEDYLASEIFNDFYLKWNAGRVIGCELLRSPTHLALIGIQRPYSTPPYGKDEITLANLLFPHIRNAVRIHQKIRVQEEARHNVWGVLDYLNTAVILFDSNCRTVFMNKAAESVIERADGIIYAKGLFQAMIPSETFALQRMIRTACKPLTENNCSAIIPILVTRKSSNLPLMIMVNRLPQNRFNDGRTTPVAVMFISDAFSPQKLQSDLIKNLFNLTQAEIRVLERILLGRNREECAHDLGISINTVKRHLQHCFEKTDTHSIVELVRLFASHGAVMR